MVKSFFIILIKYLVARPRTFTKGRQLEVQNKLLLDDLSDYPLYELTIIFFSVSIFHHGHIFFLYITTSTQFCPQSLAHPELNQDGGFGPPCVFPISKLRVDVIN